MTRINPAEFLIADGQLPSEAKAATAPTRKRRANSGVRKRLPSPERRQQLIDVARDAFAHTGREGVSTHQIASAAGVNVALLYKHFKSSAELFDVSVRLPLEATLAERVNQGEVAEYAGDDLRAQLRSLHEALLTTLIEVAPTIGIVLFSDRDTGVRFYQTYIDPLIERWIATQYRRLSPTRSKVNYSQVAKMVFGIHLSNALFAHLLNVKLDVPAVAREVSDFILLGYADV